jgi:cell division protein ZapE
MSLTDNYLAALQRGDIHDDPEQRRLLDPLEHLIHALQDRHAWYHFLLPKPSIKGLYITGPVGAGKTYMMDLFYQCLSDDYKLRVHFLHFMQQIDQKLRFLQGQRDPLIRIAKELAKQYQIICIDEFMVEDMAHAMILGELLQALFALRVVIVATSNTKIDDLYRGGLNRERFLPAIALLHQYCNEINLASKIDYRLGKTVHLHAYLYPLNKKSEQIMVQQFQDLAVILQSEQHITVQSREIAVIQLSSSVVWFDFANLCAMPRCQLDYLELAERYHTIFVSNIPKLSAATTHTAVILFIQLVDVLYDRGIRLIVSAAVPAQELYEFGPFLKEFARTLSRLEEMQSEDYLERCSSAFPLSRPAGTFSRGEKG